MGDLVSGSQVSSVQTLFDQAALMQIGSGYAASWGRISGSSENLYSGTVSHASTANIITDKTYFDVSSLTKILTTTSLVMVFVEAGILNLDSPIEVYLPEETKAHPHLKGLTLRLLLSHTSGLPWWKPYYEDLKAKFGPQLPFISITQRKEYFYSLVLATQPVSAPGQRMEYSDVGISIVGYLIEKLFAGHTLGQLARDKVWSRIPHNTLHYRPVLCDSAGAIDSKIAATEICPWRGWLQGQVHDDNAWSMGGVAAHAGVFGTLSDVVSWAQALMSERLVSMKTLNEFFTEVPFSSGHASGRAVGFDLASKDGTGSTANAFSQNSVGHLGFTGASLWIDLDSGDYACLLTNRVHPSRDDARIRMLRRIFHTIVRSHA